MLLKVKRLLSFIAFALGIIFLADIVILFDIVFFHQNFDIGKSVFPLAMVVAIAIPVGYYYIYSWIKAYLKEINNVERELEEKEERFRVLFEMASDPIFLHLLNEDGTHGAFVEANEAATEKYGYTKEEILKLTARDFVTEERRKILPKFMKEEFTIREQNRFEVTHVKKDGSLIPVELSSRTFSLHGQKFVIGIVRDMTERKRAEERARYLAYNDTLTDIPNRTYFNEKLVEVLTEAQNTNSTFSLFFMDLNDFKSINDRYGHNIGDDVLSLVAKRLQNSIRSGDILARMGGDEFIIILQGNEKEELLHVIERIHKNLEQPMNFDGQIINVLVSIGCASYPEDGDDGETLLRNADDAMYIAKRKGKNNYHFFNDHQLLTS